LADFERPDLTDARGSIAFIFGQIGAPAAPAIPALEKLAASDAGNARQMARDSLRKIRAELAVQSPAKANVPLSGEKRL
jgi:hypothetical protein